MTIATALIVDDSKMARITLKKQLEARGITSNQVASAQEAISFLNQNHPDIIFMDCLMPEMDGFEATSRITKNPKTEKIPVVMCTGKESDEDKQKAFDLGAAGYMVKSSSTEPLNAILDEMNRIASTENLVEEASETVVKQTLSADQINELIETRTRELTEQIISSQISDFSAQLTTEVNNKINELAGKVEEMTLYSIKSSLDEVQNYINAENDKLTSTTLPELKQEINQTFTKELNKITQELDSRVDQQPEIDQGTIKEMISQETAEYNQRIDKLEQQKTSSFSWLSFIAFIIAGAALALTLLPLIKPG
jgi:CheY-like chemotaxis protein